MEVIELPRLNFDDDILFVEYEFFYMGLMAVKVLMKVFGLNTNHSRLIPS